MNKKEDRSAQSLYDEAQKSFSGNNTQAALEVLSGIESQGDFSRLDPLIQMKTLSLKGICLLHRGDYKPAEEYLLRSLAIAEHLGEPRPIYIRYENLAAVYVSSKQHQKGIEYLQRSIALKESSGNHADIPRSMIQLSALEFAIENNEAGRQTLRKATALVRKYGQKELFAVLHFNNAMQLKREKKYTEALREYTTSIKHAKLINDSATAAKAYNNQGDIYIQTANWREAEKKFTEGIHFARAVNLSHIVFTSSIQLSRIALENKDIKKSREIFNYVTTHAHESDDILLQKDLSELSVMLYEAEGNYPAALAAHRDYVAYYKKFYDNELSRAVLDMQGKYETEKNERELQNANLRQVESELKALRAQMDPHFIFNALSSMRREMLEGNIENADKYLVRFSKLLRMILDTTRKPIVRLSENIELLHLYIQIENSRQGNRFDYKITAKGIDPESIYIPGLVLQPLAENAIVHGLNPKKQGRGKLNITFTRSGQVLKVKVTDNGVGRSTTQDRGKENHTSHAMNIIRETLDLIWKDKKPKNFFEVKDLKANNINKGTEVTVLLPLSSSV